MLLRSCAAASGCGTVVVTAVEMGDGDQLKIFPGIVSYLLYFKQLLSERMKSETVPNLSFNQGAQTQLKRICLMALSRLSISALQDHKEAYDRYVNLLRDTPEEHRSQMSDTQKAVIHHSRMIDHHRSQKHFHGTRAEQHESNSSLNLCEYGPVSQKAALKSAISARKSSSRAKSAVIALDLAEPRLGSRAHWRMGKAYFGDALHHTYKTKYETSWRKKILGKVFRH